MWTNTKRFQAFTLHEMMIVMILSGILLGITYYSLEVMQSYYFLYNKEHSTLNDARTLQSLLQQDFDKSSSIVADDHLILCVGQFVQITYEFKQDYVLRLQLQVIDTFYYSPENIRYFFQGGEFAPGIKQPISEMAFILQINKENIDFRAHKLYSAEELMALEEHYPID